VPAVRFCAVTSFSSAGTAVLTSVTVPTAKPAVVIVVFAVEDLDPNYIWD